MHILGVILVGFVIGLIARAVMPGKDPGGFILTTLLGIAGALIGTFLGQGLGLYLPGEPAGFLMSIVGALAVLFIYRMLAGKRAVT